MPAGRGSNPALKLPQREPADHLHPRRAVVEAGDGREICSAVLLEDVRVLERDLLQLGLTEAGPRGQLAAQHEQFVERADGQYLVAREDLAARNRDWMLERGAGPQRAQSHAPSDSR